MTKKIFKVIGISALLAAAFSMSAFADEAITSVSFACGPDAEASLSGAQEGQIDSPVFVLNDTNAEYELASYSETSTTSTVYKTARTYELQFYSNDGYYFASGDQITVTGKGITSIVSKKVEKDNNTVLTVKVKAYPYYQWAQPEFKSSDIENGKTVTFSRPGGATIEYVVTWYNQNGEQRTAHGTTSSTSLTISGYNKKLTEAQQKKVDEGDSELRDAYIQGIALRAKGNAGENTRTAPSGWSEIGSVDFSELDNIETPETWGDLYEGVAAVGGGGSSSSGTHGPSVSKLNGWNQGLEGSWYYYDNSIPRKGWLLDGGNWYYLDPTTGLMQTGWIIDNGKRYYLNPNEGGPKGAMMTGTQTIDGVTVTFDASGAAM